MAVGQLFRFLVTEVQAGAFAVAPVLAGLAVADFCPAAVPHHLVTVLPHVPDVVLVDVSLDIVPTQAGAGRNAPVAEHRRHVHTGPTEERVIAGILFVTAQKTFTPVIHVDDIQGLHLTDKVKDLPEFLVGQLEQRIVLGAALREHRRDTPALHADFQENFENLRQFLKVLPVHAGHHVESEPLGVSGHVDSSECVVETRGGSAEMVVAFLEAIQANRERAQPCIQQFGVAFRRHGKPVGHHAPGITPFLDFLAAFFQVRAHQRLAPGNHHNKVLRVDVGCKLVQHPHKVFPGHVGNGVLHAVAATVQAVQVTAQGAFPKEIGQRMRLDFVMAVEAVSLKGKFLF